MQFWPWKRHSLDDTDRISKVLVNTAKSQGSTDNITVIVVFLKEPSKIAAEAHWATRNASNLTMDTTLDNNPFAISNGATNDNNILPQKGEGLLLNLTDNFKQNGTELDISPAGEYCKEVEKTNGRRDISKEFDDEDNELHEHDLDAVDDVLMSPALAAAKALSDTVSASNNNPIDFGFSPFMDQRQDVSDFEVDATLQKQQTSEFDEHKSPREETPTPPADTVHDVGGLVDNLADSGEDSEDEWNYITGDAANKENIDPTQPDSEVAELTSPDNMSQLNPNAAEFIPISPTRSIPSPACRAIINDEVISQSPKRPTVNDIDISVPNPEEFEDEVKSRPHEVDTCSNGDDGQPLDDQHDISSKESMELFLNNGLDELKNASTPTKLPPSEEFHFGPNAAPFTPAKLLDQSEALSTKAVFGDESVATIGTTTLNESGISEATVDFSVLNKEQDPMNTSFYQDREGDKNPFDLNKVHVLPDDLDEFLNKPDEPSTLNDTISDLPEHNPLSGIGNQILDNDEKIQVTDLDKMVDDEKELASPISNDVCDFVNAHQRDDVDLLGGGGDTGFEKSPGVMSPERIVSPDLAVSPKLAEPEQGMLSENTAHSPQPEISSTEHVACELKAHSPVPIEVTPQEPIAQPSEITDTLVTNPVTSPRLSPEPTALSPEPTQGEAPSPAPQYSPALSPEPSAPPYEPDTKELIGDSQDMSEVKVPSPELVALSPEPVESHPPSEQHTISPEPVEQSAAPMSHEAVAPSSGIMSPELDELKPHSPEPTAMSPEPTTASPEPTELSTEPVSEAVEAIEAVSPEPAVEKYTQNFEAELIPSLNEEVLKSPEPLTAPLTQASAEPSEPIALSPEPTALSPEPAAQSPEPVAQSPEPVAQSPEPVAQSPEPVAQSPEPVAASPVPAAMSPEPVLSPKPVSISPEPRAPSPQSTAISLEPQLVSESPADALEDTLVQETVASETQPEVCSFSEKTFLETVKNEFTDAEKDIDEECLKKEHTFSPFEDVTSSVKDDVSSPVKDLSSPLSPDQSKVVEEAFAASPEPVAHTEALSVESCVPLQESSLLVEANQSFSGTESVATTEINSFLERSEVPDITSPLSPGQPPSHLDFEFSLPTQPVDIKTEHISREFAEPAIVTPSEESKQDDLSSSVPDDKKPEEELKDEGITKEAVAVAAAAATATAAAVAAAAAPAEKKAAPKPKSATTAAKKPAPKPLPTKAAPPKTSTTSRTTSSKPTTATTKTTTSATKTTKTTTASPKPPVPKAAPKSPPKPKTTPSTMAKTDKKLLMNGDVKTSTRTTSSYTARKIESVSKTETSKTAATKSPVTKTTTPTRPSTAPARTTTAQRTSSTTAAPKPRPTTLTSRTTGVTATRTATTASKPTTKSPVNATAAKTTSSTAAAPKPRATTAPARGRVPLTKTATKGPDTEKQNKDSANKLTASRTTTTSATSRTSAGRTVTSTVRKTETKGTTGARTITKTTTTTKPSTGGKKPTEIVRNIKTKTTTTTKTESPKENGVTTATLIVAEETTVVINSEPALELLKDNSPLDNKLLIDNALTNTAD